MSCGCGTVNTGSFVVPTIKQAVHGAIQLGKLAVGLNHASKDVVELRRNECRLCDHSTKNKDRLNTPTKGLTSLSQCTICNCLIKGKTMSADEVCPLKRW